MRKHLMMAMAATGALAALPTSAAAAQNAEYCGGKLHASFHHTIDYGIQDLRVNYYVVMQSMVAQTVNYTITFTYRGALIGQDGTEVLHLGPRGTSPAILLGTMATVGVNSPLPAVVSLPIPLPSLTRVACL